jgi:STE24 endopeptidase
MMKKLSIICLIIILFSPVSFSEKPKNTINQGLKLDHQSFNPDIETQKYLNTLTPEQKEKSDAYYEGKYWISLWAFIMELIIAWIFLSLGLSRWMKKRAEKVKYNFIQNFIYAAFYFIISFILTFPLNIYTGFFREHKYGLSNMAFTGWFMDEIKELAVIVISMSFFITILYAIVSKVRNRWWIWGYCFTAVTMIFVLLIQPVFIAPLFNNYKPLEKLEIKEQILSMARANGVPVDNVYEFNASKQSNRISANVSGIGSTIRISLNDNLLNQGTPEEIKVVMAHELGHYVLNHVNKLVFFTLVLIFLCFVFIDRAFNKLTVLFKNKWHISGVDDITGLPLAIILFVTFFFVTDPMISNTVSRSIETEADLFSINVSRTPDDFASAILKLSTYRKQDPGPLEEFLFYDHPSGKSRILSVMRWKAEHLNDK